MFYALRQRSGARDPHSAGTWLAPNGTTHRPDQRRRQDRIDSPPGQAQPVLRYPATWHLNVPILNLDVDITPRLADQELNTSTRYWEGASLIRGTRENKQSQAKPT